MLILIGLLILSFISTIRFWELPNYWLIDILSHFPAQCALLATIYFAVSLWKRKFFYALLAGLLFTLNISALVDIDSVAEASGHESENIKVYSANINKRNNEYTRLVSELLKTDADILVLLEVTDDNIKPIKSVIHKYPHSIINLNTGSSGTGTVLMSVFPILDHKVTKYSEFGNILVSAQIEISDKKVAFYAAHFPRPTIIQEFPARSKQFISLADQISRQSLPVIVAGDFNATPYSPIFKQFLEISGLKDSRKGFGWLPSWPTYLPVCWLPIDHILVSPDIQVNRRATGSYIGSDHYPIFAELSLS